MKSSQVREFAEAGVLSCVMLDNGTDYLDVSDNGKISMPEGIRPTGFYLVVAVLASSRMVVVQKNIGRVGNEENQGDYHRHSISALEDFAVGFSPTVVRDAIEVRYAGKNVWTEWHNQRSNSVYIWSVAKDGKCTVFQVGVITHDNGKTWVLVGQYAWMGRLYKAKDGRTVGVPDHVKYGDFDVRRTILDNPEFTALLKSAKLKVWKGKDEELNPPLPKATEPHTAVINWYKVCAGQSGQGPATDENGVQCWVHGVDIAGVLPDADGIVRLQQGDIVSYIGKDKFGTKKDGPLKLTGVRLMSRLP
jgi:hypothetical protein